MLALVVLVVTLAVFYYFSISNKKRIPDDYWKKRGVPYVDRNITDYNPHMKKSRLQHLNDVYNAMPNVRFIAALDDTQPKIYVRDVELVKKITVKDFDHFIDRPTLIQPRWEPLWARNLFALTGQKWRNMRSILSPAFTSSKMKLMFSLINDISQNLVDHFDKMDRPLIEIEMKDVATRFTNDAIGTTAFGVQCDSLKEPENGFYLMGKSLSDIRPTPKLLAILYKLVPLFDYIRPRGVFNRKAMAFIASLVDETVKTREEKHIVRPDMIHLLLEARKGVMKPEEKSVVDTGFATVTESNVTSGKVDAGKHLTNKDIAAQAMVFFIAGFDSVSSFLTFMAYELAVNPDIQDRLRREIMETLEETNGKATYEAIMKMKYMDMVVSETLRKWPNVINLDRICVKEYTIEPASPDERPVTLEKGTRVVIAMFPMHRDPKLYPDPEKFDPERFGDANKSKIDQYAYFPFGVGPRNCIGSRLALMEGKVFFFALLRRFELVATQRTPNPPVIAATAVVAVEGGMHLGLKRIATE